MQWGPVKRRKESQRTAVVLKVQLCTLINFFFLNYRYAKFTGPDYTLDVQKIQP